MDCCQIRLFVRKSRVDLEQLQRLLRETAFWGQHRDLEGLRTAIANSNPVVSAWSGDRLVGFARANSDGVYRATIWDVVVHPDFQGNGLGKKLVRKISAHPLLSGVERIYLMTSFQQSFYEHLGFQVNDTTTMVALNPERQLRDSPPAAFRQPVMDQPEAA